VGNIDVGVEEDRNEIITGDRFTQSNTIKINRNCKGKIVDVRTGNGSYIDVCDEISEKIGLMFSDAKKDGITLSGGGYRTYQEQVVLYNQNCAGGRRKCEPPTASPGNSMHETGKAFDLKCDGSLITFSTPYNGVRIASTKKCFDWLTQNAYKYGLQNFKKENWHWSVNGK
jgi:D-alanyl-D-alanine carboxypeptidase